MKHIDKYVSEFLGTLILLLAIVGSGMMGQAMTQNEAVVLLANSLAIGFTLVFLIITFGRRSGAHFNPAVTLVMLLLGNIKLKRSVVYIFMQILGACTGVIIANIIFGYDAVELSTKYRNGNHILFSELISTFGLLMIILLNQKNKTEISWAVNHKKYRFFMTKLIERLMTAMTIKNEIVNPVTKEW